MAGKATSTTLSSSPYTEVADPKKYRQPDATLFSCIAHQQAAVMCATAGKIGRNGRQAAAGATVFWCTCPSINKLIARIERNGGVQQVVAAFQADPALLRAQCESHITFESRVKELLESSSGPLWDFYDSHFINPPSDGGAEGQRKFGNAAVSHAGDMKCLHALVAQELCGASNPVGLVVCNYITFLYSLLSKVTSGEELTPEQRSSVESSDLFRRFILTCGASPAFGQEISMDRGPCFSPSDIPVVWRSKGELQAMTPDLCEMANHIFKTLEGKESNRSKKRRVN